MVKLESTSSETMGKQKRQVYCVKAPEKRVHKKVSGNAFFKHTKCLYG